MNRYRNTLTKKTSSGIRYLRNVIYPQIEESIDEEDDLPENLKPRPPITQRNFSGAAWVKNLCLDNRGIKRWYFSENFYNQFDKQPKEKMRYGVGFYRGQSILLWDTLRDFRS